MYIKAPKGMQIDLTTKSAPDIFSIQRDQARMCASGIQGPGYFGATAVMPLRYSWSRADM